MGKIISGWSPIHGQSCTTSNISALAAHFSLTNEVSSLITHTQLSYSSLELLFGKKKTSSKAFEHSGMAALEKLAKSNLLKSDAVIDYTESIYLKRLDLLGGTEKHVEINPHLIEVLLKHTEDAYDLVWVDAHAGKYNAVSKKLLKNSDIVLVNLPQNRFVLDRFFGGEDFPEELDGKDLIILISQYEKNSSFSIRSIKRKYKVDYPIFPILHSPEFKEASNQQNITELFYRAVYAEKEHPTHEFMSSLAKVNKYIAKKLEFKSVGVEEE